MTIMSFTLAMSSAREVAWTTVLSERLLMVAKVASKEDISSAKSASELSSLKPMKLHMSWISSPCKQLATHDLHAVMRNCHPVVRVVVEMNLEDRFVFDRLEEKLHFLHVFIVRFGLLIHQETVGHPHHDLVESSDLLWLVVP